MRWQWALNSVPRGPGRPRQRPGTNTSTTRAQNMPSNAGSLALSRLQAARKGRKPLRGPGTPCQQAHVPWKHSRENSNSETKDFLPPLARQKFPWGSSRSHRFVFTILVKIFNPLCKQEMEKEMGIEKMCQNLWL